MEPPIKTVLLLALAGALTVRPPLLAAAPPGAPESLSIAAAANLAPALGALDAEFARSNPGVTLRSATGASGSLLAQIENGAPFDVFLSADMGYAQSLAKAGHADPSSLFAFAVGRLVLWTVRPGVDVDDIAGVVRSAGVDRIAIANPKTAPYGRAARQALERLGLWGAAEPKIVVGESISQAAQFVETGNAAAGFVALSTVLSPAARTEGRWAEIPSSLYEPLKQGAVLTDLGRANPAARRYLLFLRGPAARVVLERFGYSVPSAP
jgi:molybdate transport system substrate-binding protein